MILLSEKTDAIIIRLTCDTEVETSNIKFPCGICKNNVKHNHIRIEFNDISISKSKKLQNEPENKQWVC